MLKNSLVRNKKYKVYRSEEDEKFFMYWGFEKKEWELVFDGQKVLLSNGPETITFIHPLDLRNVSIDSEDLHHILVLQLPGVDLSKTKATAHLYKDGIMTGIYRIE